MATGQPTLKKVIINSIDVSDYVMHFTVDEVFDRIIRVAGVGLKNTVSTILDFNDTSLIGTIITIQRGVNSATEKTIFKGYVRKVTFEGGKVVISCEDMLSETKYVVVNTSYDYNIDSQAGVIDAIIRDLIDDNTTGLSYTAGTTIQPSGSVNIIKKFVLKQKILLNAFQELANLIDWQIYYNSEDDKVYFEPKGFTTSTDVLSTSTNIVKLPKWDVDSSQMFNRIVVQGSPQEIFTEVGPYKLDGSQSGWSITSVLLPAKPVFVKVYSDTSNPPTTEKTGGIEGSSSTYDYEVNTENSLIEWNTDNFAPTTSYYAFVEYSFNIPVNVVRKNDVSITNYGLKSVSKYREDLKTNDDAEDWASSQLSMYSEPFYSSSLKIRNISDLQIGNLYSVEDNVNSVFRTLMIKSINYSYPYRYDTVVVADKEFRTANWGSNIQQRIRKLEENQIDTGDVLRDVVDLNRDVLFEPRYFSLQKSALSGTGGIYGHINPTWGQYGTATYGSVTRANTTPKIVQGSNTYKEFFYDTDFEGTGTANWDTSNKELSFTSGQTHTTELLTLGTAYSYFTFDYGSLTGTVTTEISGDGGSSWQTISSLNTRTAFSSSSVAGVKLRFTEAGSTTATIKNTYNTDGSYNEPGIYLKLEE